MLKQRLLTALVLGPLTLAVVFLLPTPAFAAVVAGAIALGGWEWARLAGLQRTEHRLLYVAVLLAAMGAAGAWFLGPIAAALLLLVSAWWLGSVFWVRGIERSPQPLAPMGPVAAGALGVLVLVPTWIALVVLHARPDGAWLVLLLLILTWAADAGAYFAGRALGRHKLAPRISPGKTWEGAAGGLVLGLVIAVPALWLLPVYLSSALTFLAIAAVTVVASIVGDLVESLVKRRGGVKDSGSLLPGHGGILDRMDSLTAAAPVFVAGLSWL